MASVKQMRPDGPFYVCYKRPTGTFDSRGQPVFERVQEPSGLYDRKKALMLAISYEEVAEAAATKRFTETMARNFLARVASITNVHTANTESLEEYIRRWVTSRTTGVAEKTRLNYDKVIRDFLAFAAAKGIVSVADVSHRLMTDFRDGELQLGKSGATINKALSILGQAFESAVISQVLPVNPVRGLRIKGAQNRPQSRRAFTFEEFATLVARTGKGEKSSRGHELHPDWQTFILLCGYTGGRQQEVAKLNWGQVDLANGRIVLRRTKNHDTHVVPIHPALMRHLVDLRRRTPDTQMLVLPHIAAAQGRYLSKYFRDIVLPRIDIRQPYLKRKRVKCGEPGRKVGRRLAEYSLHSLRHSLSSWLNAQGVPEMTRMRLVGHEDTEVSRAYTHEEHQQLAAALMKIPDVLTLPMAPSA